MSGKNNCELEMMLLLQTSRGLMGIDKMAYRMVSFSMTLSEFQDYFLIASLSKCDFPVQQLRERRAVAL